jgi:NADH-quinone oxidoreductase subunit L
MMMTPEAGLVAAVAISFASAAVLAVAGGQLGRAAGWIGTLAVAAAFAAGLPAASVALDGGVVEARPWTWIDAPGFVADVHLCLDALSATILLVVTGVGALIHLYSVSYMAGDRGVGRYFALLNLFVGFMLLLVTAGNLLLLFVGWEGVGLCSYLLIGFQYDRPAASAAGLKAFIVNRVGDVAFLLGTLLLWTSTGTLEIAAAVAHGDRLAEIPVPVLNCSQATLACLLLFFGACGKSAQIPLHTWLPDAMEGPTPVSALIHAATMVTAGVYLVARTGALFAASPAASDVVVAVGAATALYAAVCALAQDDLKRIWAYSTISQLGYMFVAVGLGAVGAGIGHLVAHAFFKAGLFLAAGSVMHALAGETNVWRMGGLLRAMPWTSAALVAGAAALAGIPPFAGWWSKDLILEAAAGRPAIFAVLIATAFVTAVYAGRAVSLVVLGAPRGERHAHESPWTMRVVLVVLAGFSLLWGWKVPHVSWVPVVATAVALAGAAAGLWLYHGVARDPLEVVGAWRVRAAGGLGFDAAYQARIVEPCVNLFRAVRDRDERWIDGAGHALAGAARTVGDGLVGFQTGRISTYLLYLALGAAAILFAALRGVAF